MNFSNHAFYCSTTLRFADALPRRLLEAEVLGEHDVGHAGGATRTWRNRRYFRLAVASLSARSFPLGVAASHAPSSNFHHEYHLLRDENSLLSQTSIYIILTFVITHKTLLTTSLRTLVLRLCRSLCLRG